MITRKESTQRISGAAEGGFTMVEIMVALAIFSTVAFALSLASTSLQRNFAAVTRYSADHAAQMRISDYIALDLRRSISVTISTPNNISMVIPKYLPTPAPSPTAFPTPYMPKLDGAGGVYYSADTKPSNVLLSDWPSAKYTVTVSYYLQNGSVYRLEGSASPVALADNAEDFVFTPTAADLGKVIETTITFKPTFKSSGASIDAIAATTFHNRTLLRNNVNVY